MLKKTPKPPKQISCPNCGGTMERGYWLETTGRRAWQWNQGEPFVAEHVNVEGEGPITFNSRKELQDHCRKHGIESGALL